MPSTTFHFPPNVLERIDAVAARLGVSRNRFVLDACERAIEEDEGEWPEGFFDSPLEPGELGLLREATEEIERSIAAGRRNRGGLLF